MLSQRRRRWANIEPTLELTHRLRRWPNIKTTLSQRTSLVCWDGHGMTDNKQIQRTKDVEKMLFLLVHQAQH